MKEHIREAQKKKAASRSASREVLTEPSDDQAAESVVASSEAAVPAEAAVAETATEEVAVEVEAAKKDAEQEWVLVEADEAKKAEERVKMFSEGGAEKHGL